MLSNYLPVEVKMSGLEVMEVHPNLSSLGKQTKPCFVYSTCSTRDDTLASDCYEFFTSKGFRPSKESSHLVTIP